ncbi:MAG: SulP family inorganic anion transporter, partial [Verrucomicrobiales bacterium]
MNLSRTLTRAARDIAGFLTSGQVQPFPFVGSLRRYNFFKARHDARAALNVAMLAIPQAMAFASIAQLPIVFGILCAIVEPLVAPLFAGSSHTSLGPTNATAFM